MTDLIKDSVEYRELKGHKCEYEKLFIELFGEKYLDDVTLELDSEDNYYYRVNEMGLYLVGPDFIAKSFIGVISPPSLFNADNYTTGFVPRRLIRNLSELYSLILDYINYDNLFKSRINKND